MRVYYVDTHRKGPVLAPHGAILNLNREGASDDPFAGAVGYPEQVTDAPSAFMSKARDRPCVEEGQDRQDYYQGNASSERDE
jgi:hypothetical protein